MPPRSSRDPSVARVARALHGRHRRQTVCGVGYRAVPAARYPALIAHGGVSCDALESAQRQMDGFEPIGAAGTTVWWGICGPQCGAPLIGDWLLPEKWWGQGAADPP